MEGFAFPVNQRLAPCLLPEPPLVRYTLRGFGGAGMRRSLAAAAGAAGGLTIGLIGLAALNARRAEAAVPKQGKLVTIDGSQLHYVELGSGPPILMVHGLAGNLRNFARSVVEDLSRDHRVILLDRPGSGYSVRGKGVSARLPDQAALVAKFIERLDIGRPLLVGHSLGGAVSLALALDRPDLVRGLALIAPLTQPQEEYARVFRSLELTSPLVRRAVAWTLATPFILANRSRAQGQIFGPEPVPHDFGTAGGGLLSARPAAFYEASSDMVAINRDIPAIAARYVELRLPVDILFARGDRLLDFRKHGEQTAREIGGARLELVDGGHMIPFTQPGLTVGWLRRVLARQAAAAA